MAVTKKVVGKNCGLAGKKIEKGCSSKGKNISQDALACMINERAYYIWEQRGKPEGQDFDIWLQAEKEMLSRCK